MHPKPQVYWRLLVAVLAVVSGSLVMSASAAAHSDLDYTVPTDGAAVGEPVSEITVAFTEAVTLIGPGFEVLDPQGRVLQPFAVTDDSIVFRLQLDPPLGGGAVAVKYEVAAADGHVLDGNFTFTVAADAPVVTDPLANEPPVTEPPVTEPPVTEPPATSPPSEATTTTPATPESAATVADRADVSAVADAPDDDDDDGSGSSIALIGVGVVVAGAVGFLLLRLRRPPTS